VDQLFWWSCLPERDQRFGQRVAYHCCAAIPRKLMPHQRLTRAKSAVLDRFWAPLASAHLLRTIRRVQPDLIWAIPHNWSVLPLASALPKASVCLHVTMQDYVDVHGQVEKFGPARCRRMAELADLLYTLATTRDATSHPMIEDLRKRTGAAASQVLHSGLEQEDFSFLESKAASHPKEISIGYAGTILAQREFALFVEALIQARPFLRSPISLHLFGAHSYAGSGWFDPTWMHEGGNLPEEKLLNALRRCNWGFAPMELTDHDPRYNRFSFPTKFITYLAAGLPIITLAHRDSSMAKMAAAFKVGLLSHATEASTLSKELSNALNDPNPWDRYRTEVIRCALTEFDAARTRRELWDCFSRAASAKS
jgi:hypothetical protein